jgi:hypothetical protein
MCARGLAKEIDARRIEINGYVTIGIDPPLDETDEREMIRADLCDRIGKLR